MSSPNQTIEFVDAYVPPITPGRYTVTVTQDVYELDADKKIKPLGAHGPYPTLQKTVHVQGDRFSIDPRDIHAVYPPDGGMGDYGNEHALPHIAFSVKSLPWDQVSGLPAAGKHPPAPWLALLVFHETDEGGLPAIVSAMVGDLSRGSFPPGASLAERPSTLMTAERKGTASYADLVKPKTWAPRLGENAWDACQVVDIPLKLFALIAPTQADLPWLAHARIASRPEETRTYSTVIANRLPLREGTSMACLVSLAEIAQRLPPAQIALADGETATHLRLVVLKAWSFRCGAALQGFNQDLTRGPLKVPYTPPGQETPEDLSVREALAMGYTALDHNTRWGDQAVSWYRGPFLPFSSKVTDHVPQPPICAEGYETGIKPISCADEALRYDPELGMQDVSYAAAWQLGRLIALRDETFARDLYQWKRENKRRILAPQAADVFAFLAELMQAAMQRLNPAQAARDLLDDPARLKAHLAGTRAPESVVSRLDKLRRLEGVPLDYLVPDERMLPAESLRFFQVDQNWVYSLVEGAYSIARVSTDDQKQDAATCPHEVYRQVSGFLLRSKIVSGWPHLKVEVEVSDPSAKFKTLRCERLTPDILLFLVEVEGSGIITSATLRVPPENIEFHAARTAQFRDSGKSVLDIVSLATGESSSADFGVSLALKPLVTPGITVDKALVYPGETVKIRINDCQEGVWYGIGEGGNLSFGQTGPTFGYTSIPIFADTEFQVFAEFPLNGRRKLLCTLPIKVSRRVPPDDSLEVALVNTMYGELLPNEFFLGRKPLVRVGGSQKYVTYQLLADGIPAGDPVVGGGDETRDLYGTELKKNTTYTVRASRSSDPDVFVVLKQSVKVIAVPDRYVGVNIANAAHPGNISIPSGSATKVLISSQIGVLYTMLTWPLHGEETKRKEVCSAVGTGRTVELPTGPMTESTYFVVTAKFQEARLMELFQGGLIQIVNTESL